MPVRFAWDTEKSERNRRDRGFGFDFAALVFSGPTVEAEDARCDYGEARIQALGMAGGVLLLVVYTQREDVRRIISARLANRKERARWPTPS